MSRFQRSWNLFLRSLRVVGDNKKLLVFPLISAAFVGIIVLFFIVPITVLAVAHSIGSGDFWANSGYRPDLHSQAGSATSYLLYGVIYLIAMFASTFSNVAFYNEILNALNGRPVSVLGGLRFASSRLKAILLWSLFAGVVGLIIKSLERRVGLIGRLVVGLIGIGWSVASIFVIPSIVREENGANPVQMLKSSAALLKKTWGESLIGYVGMGIGGLLILLTSLLWFGINLGLTWLIGSGAIMVVAVIIWVVSFIAFWYTLGVTGQVYRGALFIYATEGVVPEPFDPDQMNMAWKIKSGRKAL